MSVTIVPDSAQPTPTGEGRTEQVITHRKKKWQTFPYALLLPSIVVLLLMVAWPLIKLVITSFQKYGRAQAFGAPAEWTGLDNYKAVLTDPDFWAMLARSFAFMVAAVVLTIGLGILVALLMMRLNKFFRLVLTVALLLAWAMPALTATIVWGWMVDTDYGVLNYLLSKVFGEQWIGHNWLLGTFSFFVVLTFIIVWQGIPFVAFTMYAGLTQISSEVLEAAQIDGASAPRRFFSIQIPYVRPVLTVLIVLSIIWDLRVFAQVYALQALTSDLSSKSTLGVWIFQKGTASGDYGVSGAAAVVMVVVMLIISWYYVRETVKEDDGL